MKKKKKKKKRDACIHGNEEVRRGKKKKKKKERVVAEGVLPRHVFKNNVNTYIYDRKCVSYGCDEGLSSQRFLL